MIEFHRSRVPAMQPEAVQEAVNAAERYLERINKGDFSLASAKPHVVTIVALYTALRGKTEGTGHALEASEGVTLHGRAEGSAGLAVERIKRILLGQRGEGEGRFDWYRRVLRQIAQAVGLEWRDQP